MPYYHLLEITDLILIFFILVLGWYREKILDTAAKIFCVLMAITLVEEGIAYYCNVRFHQNLFVLRIFSVVEMTMLSFYFNYSIPVFRKRNTGIYIGVAGFLIGLIDCLISKNLNQFSSFYIFLEGAAVISMALFSLLQYLKNYPHQVISKLHFWIAAILIIFWSFTIINLSFYNILAKAVPGYKFWCGYFFFGINYLCYAATIFIFFYYPKMNKANE